CLDAECFLDRLNAQRAGSEYNFPFDILTGIRFAVGGLQLDPFTAPADPLYYLIMANVDRLWAIWQMQDLEARRVMTGGTHTPYNVPPSEVVDTSKYMYMDNVAPPRQVFEFMST